MEIYSNTQTLSIGVQQGSLLGVLLFQITINDLPRALKFCSSILYADDTTIYVLGKSLRFLKLKMEEDLRHLSSWLCLNNMKLNVSKSKLLLFNKEGLMPHVDLSIEGEAIEDIREFKLLGIWLDPTLSFSEHYKAVHDRLLKSSFVIGSLCRSLPLDCMRQLYFAYYDSHLSYGALTWHPMLLK